MKIVTYASFDNPESDKKFLNHLEKDLLYGCVINALLKKEKEHIAELFKDDSKMQKILTEGVSIQNVLFSALPVLRFDLLFIQLCEKYAEPKSGWKVEEFNPAEQYIFRDDTGVELIFKK